MFGDPLALSKSSRCRPATPPTPALPHQGGGGLTVSLPPGGGGPGWGGLDTGEAFDRARSARTGILERLSRIPLISLPYLRASADDLLLRPPSAVNLFTPHRPAWVPRGGVRPRAGP